MGKKTQSTQRRMVDVKKNIKEKKNRYVEIHAPVLGETRRRDNGSDKMDVALSPSYMSSLVQLVPHLLVQLVPQLLPLHSKDLNPCVCLSFKLC